MPENIRNKLQPRFVRCFSLGYDHVTKAYHLFNPWTRKIVISKETIFDERALGMKNVMVPTLLDQHMTLGVGEEHAPTTPPNSPPESHEHPTEQEAPTRQPDASTSTSHIAHEQHPRRSTRVRRPPTNQRITSTSLTWRNPRVLKKLKGVLDGLGQWNKS